MEPKRAQQRCAQLFHGTRWYQSLSMQEEEARVSYETDRAIKMARWALNDEVPLVPQRPRPSCFQDLTQGGPGLAVSEKFVETVRRHEAWPFEETLFNALRHYQSTRNIEEYEAARQIIDLLVSGGDVDKAKYPVEAAIFENVKNLLPELAGIPEGSLLGDWDEFPMEVAQRDHFALRLVYIDTVGLSFSYGGLFSGRVLQFWEKDHFDPEQRLYMRPILNAVYYYLLTGHKVVVLFPLMYHPDNWAEGEKKVDNIVVFEHLCQAGIVEFVGIRGDHRRDIWVPKLALKVEENNAQLISYYPLLEECRGGVFDQAFENQPILTTIPPIYRQTNPILVFPGRIPIYYHDYTIEIDANKPTELTEYGDDVHVTRKNDNNYVWIEPKLVKYMADTDGMVDFFAQQLTFNEQYRLVRFLETLLSWDSPQLRRAYLAFRYIAEHIRKIFLHDANPNV